ncbi:MAG: hypothetical protein AAF846_25375 [Chloroflexota bacterium]
MPTTIYFTFNSSPIPRNAQVKIHWKGFLSGYSSYQADDSGAITVSDDELKGSSRTAEHIYVRLKRNERAYAKDNVTIRKNDDDFCDVTTWRRT